MPPTNNVQLWVRPSHLLPSVSCILDVASGHGNVIGDGYHLIRDMAVVLRLLEVLRELRVACKKIREQWVQWVQWSVKIGDEGRGGSSSLPTLGDEV